MASYSVRRSPSRVVKKYKLPRFRKGAALSRPSGGSATRFAMPVAPRTTKVSYGRRGHHGGGKKTK